MERRGRLASAERSPTILPMSTVGEIETALKKLPVKKARAVASWLQDYLARDFDMKFK